MLKLGAVAYYVSIVWGSALHAYLDLKLVMTVPKELLGDQQVYTCGILPLLSFTPRIPS